MATTIVRFVKYPLRADVCALIVLLMSNAVHLQGIGLVNAIPAGQLTIGSRTVWNYGYVETVLAIAPKGKLSLAITIRSERSGSEHVRTLRKSRLVAVAS